MKTRDQSQLPPNPSLNEDYQERSLRILGRLIARQLLKRRRGYEDKTWNQKTDDLQAPGNPI